jgi:hypothetical protein
MAKAEEVTIQRKVFENQEKFDGFLKTLIASNIIAITINYIPMAGNELKFIANVIYKVRKIDEI